MIYTIIPFRGGCDQAATVEVIGFAKLIHGVRTIEITLINGLNKFYDIDLGTMKKLRLK
jgi:hypothetical protein